MAGFDVLRPDANISVGGGWAPTGLGTVHATLADASDSTYAENTTSYSRCVIGLDDPTLPSGIRITGVQLTTRLRRGAGATKVSLTTFLDGEDDPDDDEFTVANSPTDYVGKIRSRQPNGKLWTRAAVEALGATLKVSSGVTNVRAYRIDVVVTWVIQPTITVTAPTGTQIVSQPTTTWDFSHEDGLKQNNLHVRVFTEAAYTDGGFDPETSPAVYDTGAEHSQDQTRVIRTDLTNGNYQAWVRAGIQLLGFPLWSDWESISFAVDFDEASTPILVATPDTANGRVNLVLTGTDNLLCAQEASLEAEAGTGYWVATNCVLVRSAAQALHGANSIRLTASSAADMSIQTSYYLRCRPGQIYQQNAEFRAATTARQTEFEFEFYDDALALLDTDTSAQTADSNAAWTLPAAYVAAAPTNAVWMRPTLRIKAPANGEQHYIDAMKVSALLSDFSRGGIVDRNLLTRNQSALETDASGWNPVGATTIAQSGTQKKSGSFSLRLTAPGGAAASALTDDPATVDDVRITPGVTYTAFASSRAGTTVRPVQVGIRYYDVDGLLIDSLRGERVTNTNSDWSTLVSVSRIAPAGAVSAAVLVVAGSPTSLPATSELHYFDEISLSVDSSTEWMPGGTLVGATTPIVQFTDDLLTVADEDATWAPITSQTLMFDQHQELDYIDNSVPPALTRRYRARILATEAGSTIASAWSATVTADLPTTVPRLKNTLDPGMDYAFDDPSEGITKAPTKQHERGGRFDPLDEPYPVFVSGGMQGEDGAVEAVILTDAHWAEFRRLLRHEGTLLLVWQTEQRFIRIESDRDADLEQTEPGPRFTVNFDYFEAERP